MTGCLSSLVRGLSVSFLLTLPAAAAADARISESYGKLPLHFEANQGQEHEDVRFLSRGPGYSLYLTTGEAVLAIAQPSDTGKSAALRMSLVGAARKPVVSGTDELPGKSNYFIGQDPSQWRTNVPTYAKVHYREVYPGIDLVYYGNQRQLEYDFVVAPGADPKKILLAFKGADKIEIDTQGDLVLHMGGESIRQKKPVIYQEVDGIRQEIAGSYVRKGANRIGLKVAAYDRSRPLVIDPVLSYSTFLGGSGLDQGHGIAVDAGGNAYVTGSTLSSNFPTSSGASHTGLRIFVTKLNPTGSALAYSILLGGSNESSMSSSIAVDAAGNAYVTGSTSSDDFPTTSGAFQTSRRGPSDAFVTKLNPTGSVLVYSTYLGGSNEELSGRIAVDAAGNAYVTGGTFSADFPTTAGAFDTTFKGADAYVTKLDPSGSQLVYSTYLGASGNERGTGIAVDAAGSAYVTGVATLADPGGPFTHLLPTTAGAFQRGPGGLDDAFVAKFNPTGSALVYCTYLGGADPDGGRAIAVDVDGNAYVTGTTSALIDDFPTTAGAFQTTQTNPGARGGFVTKLNPLGSALVYSTYFLPGSNIAVDAAGSAYVTGAAGTDFPTTPGAFQTTHAGGGDAFITKFDPSGSSLLYSTYLGGVEGDSGSGIAVDTAGNAYVTGLTSSTNFPAKTGAVDTTFNGSVDAFVAKFAFGGGTSPGPFTGKPIAIPATFEAENFDRGGEGVAYHDNVPGNAGGAYRAEDVDIIPLGPLGPGTQFAINNFETGEWLAYTISVAVAGTYSLELQAATSFDFPNPAYHAEIDGVNVTGTVVLRITGDWTLYAWVGKVTVQLPAGQHVLKIVSERQYFNLNRIRLTSTTASTPHTGTPISVPAQWSAVGFDNGGEGVAYHDNVPGNAGGQLRPNEDVDIISSGGNYVVNNFETGEWLLYTVNVQATGNYDIRLFVSSEFANSGFHVEIDDTDVTGRVTVPNTGNWNTFQWVGKQAIRLTAGQHVLKVVSDQQYFNLRDVWVVARPSSTPFTGKPVQLPALIEAENFDRGGEGVAYHDNIAGNAGGQYRTGEDVDIIASTDTVPGTGGFVVNNFETGEWLAYTVNSNGGSFDVTLRAATSPDFPDAAYHIEIDGVNVSGTIVLPDTGGWNNFQWVGLRPVQIPAGERVLKIVSERQYFNLNAINVAPRP